jgi:hypothetical protein
VPASLRQTGLTRLAVGGGVSANRRLRDGLATLDAEVFIPPMELCTDNAAMAALAVEKWRLGDFAPAELDANRTFCSPDVFTTESQRAQRGKGEKNQGGWGAPHAVRPTLLGSSRSYLGVLCDSVVNPSSLETAGCG